MVCCQFLKVLSEQFRPFEVVEIFDPGGRCPGLALGIVLGEEGGEDLRGAGLVALQIENDRRLRAVGSGEGLMGGFVGDRFRCGEALEAVVLEKFPAHLIFLYCRERQMDQGRGGIEVVGIGENGRGFLRVIEMGHGPGDFPLDVLGCCGAAMEGNRAGARVGQLPAQETVPGIIPVSENRSQVLPEHRTVENLQALELRRDRIVFQAAMQPLPPLPVF